MDLGELSASADFPIMLLIIQLICFILYTSRKNCLYREHKRDLRTPASLEEEVGPSICNLVAVSHPLSLARWHQHLETVDQLMSCTNPQPLDERRREFNAVVKRT